MERRTPWLHGVVVGICWRFLKWGRKRWHGVCHSSRSNHQVHNWRARALHKVFSKIYEVLTPGTVNIIGKYLFEVHNIGNGIVLSCYSWLLCLFYLIYNIRKIFTIERLNNRLFHRYSISVRAFNSAGAGPASGPVNTLTKENGKS